jgi:hypothetical protein
MWKTAQLRVRVIPRRRILHNEVRHWMVVNNLAAVTLWKIESRDQHAMCGVQQCLDVVGLCWKRISWCRCRKSKLIVSRASRFA